MEKELKDKKVSDLTGGELYDIIFEAIKDVSKIIKVKAI
jgi:hypothetical protein